MRLYVDVNFHYEYQTSLHGNKVALLKVKIPEFLREYNFSDGVLEQLSDL